MISSLLDQYNKLVTDCRDLLEMEIAEHQAGRGGQDSSIRELKQDLIEQLGDRLGELRTARASGIDSTMVDKSQLNYLQQTFMQLLRMDRELERHLLVGNAVSSNARLNRLNHPGFAARMYGQNQLGSS